MTQVEIAKILGVLQLQVSLLMRNRAGTILRRELEGWKQGLTIYKYLYMLSTWLGRECGLRGRATLWKSSPRFLPKPDSN
jgi:hypothetical protein